MKRELIQEQIAYYRARAAEYDDWFFRRGRYDRGRDFNEQWTGELAAIRESLARLGPFDSALELACGTGLWTQELARNARRVVAVDASPEMLAFNRQRLKACLEQGSGAGAPACHSLASDSPAALSAGVAPARLSLARAPAPLPNQALNDPRVEYQQADLFAWEPAGEFDLVFIAFWLSHVPPESLDDFLGKVRRSVRTSGRLFVVDSLFEPASTATDHLLAEKGQNWQLRKLGDGREFKVVKIFYEPAELAEKLATAGFDMTVKTSGRFFLHGCGTRH